METWFGGSRNSFNRLDPYNLFLLCPFQKQFSSSFVFCRFESLCLLCVENPARDNFQTAKLDSLGDFSRYTSNIQKHSFHQCRVVQFSNLHPSPPHFQSPSTPLHHSSPVNSFAHQSPPAAGATFDVFFSSVLFPDLSYPFQI